jgi:hypothetical protein
MPWPRAGVEREVAVAVIERRHRPHAVLHVGRRAVPAALQISAYSLAGINEFRRDAVYGVRSHDWEAPDVDVIDFGQVHASLPCNA